MTMKFTHSTKNSSGIGLIEVLVTTVVVAVGLLAVATLQGDLIGDSRTNKTLAECQSLANTKMEQLRDTIIKACPTGTTCTNAYNTLVSSTANESIAGVTETFSRLWLVTDETNPTRKRVRVKVSWDNFATSDKLCVVQSVIAFDNVGNSGLAAEGAGQSGAAVSGPSTNANSSNEITQTINLPTAGTPGSVYTAPDGKTYIVQDNPNKAARAATCDSYAPALSVFENDLYTRRIDHDGATGNEAIELYESVLVGGVNYCIPRIRFNGGVIIPIRGIVHSGATSGNGNNQTLLDVNLFTFNASETGTYCVFKPQAGAKSAPYVCYVGGNCKFGPNGSVADPVTECPYPTAVSAAIVGPGGWRGKVGLLGVAANGNNVCFGEEISGAPVTLDTARNYYTRNAGLNEGINKPYSCHDFLIINGKSTEAQVHTECVTQASAIGGFQLASKTIARNITGNNVFDPTIDTSYCAGAAATAYTITGTISGAAAAPTVTVTDGTTTSNCTTTTTTYSCLITTTSTSVTVSGTYNSQPLSCAPLTISSGTPSTTDCLLAYTAMPVYTITGHISATTAAAANAVSLKVVDGANNVNCTNNLNYASGYNTYTCSISTLSTTGVTINATATTGYAVSPTTYAVPTLSGTTSSVVVPSTANDFVGSVVPTYTISGSIALGNNVDNLTSLTTAVNTGTGSCTITPPNGGWKKNTTGSYSCTVYAGSNSLSVAISPTCSNTKVGNTDAFQRYTMSSTGVTSTTGTGQLVIDLGTVSGNLTHNISIAESTTAC